MLSEAYIETALIFLLSGMPHAILIVASVGFATFLFFLIIEKNIGRVRILFFQNLNYLIFKVMVIDAVICFLIAKYFFDLWTLAVISYAFGFFCFFILFTHYDDSLDEEMQDVFNHDKSWWQTVWKNKNIVDSRYLSRDTYHRQREKIQAQMVKLPIGTDANKKLNSEISQTISIIDNIDEIFRKSLKRETTMLKNKDLLWNLYVELKDRYEYFEQKYHDLLQENYAIKHGIAQTIANNAQSQAQKDLLKNL